MLSQIYRPPRYSSFFLLLEERLWPEQLKRGSDLPFISIEPIRRGENFINAIQTSNFLPTTENIGPIVLEIRTQEIDPRDYKLDRIFPGGLESNILRYLPKPLPPDQRHLKGLFRFYYLLPVFAYARNGFFFYEDYKERMDQYDEEATRQGYGYDQMVRDLVPIYRKLIYRLAQILGPNYEDLADYYRLALAMGDPLKSEYLQLYEKALIDHFPSTWSGLIEGPYYRPDPPRKEIIGPFFEKYKRRYAEAIASVPRRSLTSPIETEKVKIKRLMDNLPPELRDEKFFDLLYRTGGVISGSFVVKTYQNDDFKNNDVDIYTYEPRYPRRNQQPTHHDEFKGFRNIKMFMQASYTRRERGRQKYIGFFDIDHHHPETLSTLGFYGDQKLIEARKAELESKGYQLELIDLPAIYHFNRQASVKPQDFTNPKPWAERYYKLDEIPKNERYKYYYEPHAGYKKYDSFHRVRTRPGYLGYIAYHNHQTRVAFEDYLLSLEKVHTSNYNATPIEKFLTDELKLPIVRRKHIRYNRIYDLDTVLEYNLPSGSKLQIMVLRHKYEKPKKGMIDEGDLSFDDLRQKAKDFVFNEFDFDFCKIVFDGQRFELAPDVNPDLLRRHIGRVSQSYMDITLKNKGTINAVYRGTMTIQRALKYTERGYQITNLDDFFKVCDQAFFEKQERERRLI